MLDTSIRTVFIPGSNLKGNVAGANWSFLLPKMTLDSILCLGKPSPRTQKTLSHLGNNVLILTKVQTIAPARPNEPEHLGVQIREDPGDISIPVHMANGTVDLVIVSGGEIIRKVMSNASLRTDLVRLLSPRGWIYLELNGWIDQLSTQKKARQLASTLGKGHFFWTSPLLGEIHTAVPDADRSTINYFIRYDLHQPAAKRNFLAQARRLLLKLMIQKFHVRRQSILVSSENGFDGQSPPAYLCTLASQVGLDIKGYRWGLVAHGEYSTRKVLFYLFRPGDSSPEVIVKLVRDSAHNLRLENENRALTALWDKGLGALNFLPRPVFFGYHNDLAILGEGAISGKSLRNILDDQPNFPRARLAVQHLTELGSATGNPYSTSPGDAAETLMRLFETFVEIYQPNREVRAFLENQISAIATLPGTFPLVFQHGDPGAWNILVTADEDVIFLDWESAEPNGVPLWDLFYFLRSYAVGLARKAGAQDSLLGFERQILSDTPFSRFAIEAIQTYCEKLHLQKELIEPLFYTCWMHRSLKEANRLRSHQLQKSHYYNLLLLTIQNNETAQMSRLLGAGFGWKGSTP